jgi:phosphatidylglycerophosphate synthase
MIAALALIIISRIGDGLDGSVARASARTDFGGYLDITLDFVFYGAIPLGFVMYDPLQTRLPARR